MSNTRTIWKFGVDEKVLIPRGSQILCVQVQSSEPKIWVLVDPLAKNVCRRFAIRGTGEKITTGDAMASYNDPVGRYVGTWQTTLSEVWHLFDLGEEEIR